MNMVEVSEESVMLVKAEMEDDSLPFSRAKSPTDTNTLSMEELVCTRCDEAMGPCKLDHTEEEEENICSIILERNDRMD